MEKEARTFKDDILQGVALALKNLQIQQANHGVTFKQDGGTKQIRSDEDVFSITKNNPHLRNLLNFLDLTFNFGLKEGGRGYWPLVKRVAHGSVIEMIEKHKQSSTEISKGYIWLYLTVIEDSLESYLRMLLLDKKLIKMYYKKFAMLRDDEKTGILLHLLVGMETLPFNLDFESPYLDFGHDPVLRQEKVVIRIQPQEQPTDRQIVAAKPDVAAHADYSDGSSRVPDLIRGGQRYVSQHSAPEGLSPTDNNTEETVEAIPARSMTKSPYTRKKTPRTKSEGDNEDEEEDESVCESIDLEEDHYTPQMLGTPVNYDGTPVMDFHGFKVAADHGFQGGADHGFQGGADQVLQTCDPFSRHYSQGEVQYQDFLSGYTNLEGSTGEASVDDSGQGGSEVDEDTLSQGVEGEGEFESSYSVEEHLRALNLADGPDAKAYTLTYVSEDEDENPDPDLYGQDDFDHEMYRTDSFDRFCRRSPVEEDGTIDEIAQDADDDEEEGNSLNAAVGVPPRISKDTLDEINSPLSQSLSSSSIEKINDARFDTNTGILLPTLPRRPDYKEAAKLAPEEIVDSNSLVLISLAVYENEGENFVKLFRLSIGHLAGLAEPMFLMVTNVSLYLLSRSESEECGYKKEFSIRLDSINKIQIGLNYQDIYISHDHGCFHVATADEVITRGLVSTVKAQIKSSQGGKSTGGEQPMASNTNNELEIIIQDWIVCTTGEKEPDVMHFCLVHYYMLRSEETPENRVVRAGYIYHKHSILGVMGHWEVAFFALRGGTLSQYSAKKQELKSVFDLGSKCGGCARGPNEDGMFTFKILASDGSTVLLNLAVDNEKEANDWIVTICQAVADAKSGAEDSVRPDTMDMVACGLVLTEDKLFLFKQEPKSGRLSLEDSCAVQDITQVCVDNDSRDFCTLLIDHNIEQHNLPNKSSWLLKFNSEYELGKFEQKVYACWHSLYQVPLQFVLLSESPLKKAVKGVLSRSDVRPPKEVEHDTLAEILSY